MNNDPEAHTTVNTAQQPPITTEKHSESDEESLLFPSSVDDVGDGEEFEDDDNVFNKAGEEDSLRKTFNSMTMRYLKHANKHLECQVMQSSQKEEMKMAVSLAASVCLQALQGWIRTMIISWMSLLQPTTTRISLLQKLIPDLHITIITIMAPRTRRRRKYTSQTTRTKGV